MSDANGFWEKLIDNSEDTSTRIVSVLKARGFFINAINEKYYISDNISLADLNFLKKGLNYYNLGRLIDNNERQNKSRYIFSEEENKYIIDSHYKMFHDNSIQLIINDDARVEDAIAFFYCTNNNTHSTGQNRATMICDDESFQTYWSYDKGAKPNLETIESNISLYVKAISACGVRTYSSCDGNHDNGGVIYVYSNNPSNIWHKSIWNNIVIPQFGNIPFIEDGIPFNNADRDEKYYLIYLIANYLYDKRESIIELKKKSVDSFKYKYHYDKSYDDLLKEYEEKCKKLDVQLE